MEEEKMKIMKKFLIAAVIAVLALFSFSACGGAAATRAAVR